MKYFIEIKAKSGSWLRIYHHEFESRDSAQRHIDENLSHLPHSTRIVEVK